MKGGWERPNKLQKSAENIFKMLASKRVPRKNVNAPPSRRHRHAYTHKRMTAFHFLFQRVSSDREMGILSMSLFACYLSSSPVKRKKSLLCLEPLHLCPLPCSPLLPQRPVLQAGSTIKQYR